MEIATLISFARDDKFVNKSEKLQNDMQIDILTLFPKMFEGPFDESILRRAQDKLLVKINLHDMRKWAVDKRGSVDDRPYGGGAGMVIRVEVIARALQQIINYQLPRLQLPSATADGGQAITNKIQNSINLKDSGQVLRQAQDVARMTEKKQRIILLTPQGEVFTQEKARELAKLDRVILICGHYEGFDERIREHLVDEELSIGEYVLTGGELPAMVVTDAITRLIPGVLLKEDSTKYESFGNFDTDEIKNQKSKIKMTTKNSKFKNEEQGIKHEDNSQPVTRNLKTKLLEYPQYTRPEEFNGWKVPEVLLSGDHKRIEEWKRSKLKLKTKKVK